MNRQIITAVLLTLIIGMYSPATSSIEVEGCFALNSFARNVKVSLIEKAGFLFRNNIAVTLFGEQQFRTSACIISLFPGVEYRFGKDRFMVPLGVFGGMYDVHIGQYATAVPVAGANTGFFFFLNDAASLRLNYFAKLYFDEEKVFGNDAFLGLAFIIRMNRRSPE